MIEPTRNRAGARRLVRLTFALLALAFALPATAAPTPADGGAGGVINVNTASVEELQQIPGVGEVRARAIVDARKRRGGFRSVDELAEVKGIGEASLERMRPHVTVTGKRSGGPR